MKSKLAEPLTARPRLPRAQCEEILQAGRAMRIADEIWPSQVKVIDRLLARSLELSKAYDEIVEKLDNDRTAIEVFLDAVLSAAATWGPDKLTQARMDRRELVKVNKRIGKLAAELGDLLDRREELHNHSGFASQTHYSVLNLIQDVGQSHGHFRLFAGASLAKIRSEFGPKYWPKIADVVRAIGSDAEAAQPQATDPLTAAGSEGRNGRASFLKVLLAAFDENSAAHGGFLPADFTLSDGALADLMTAALDLQPDADVDREFVKRFRQREREGEKELE